MALFRDRLPLDFRRLASPVKDRRFLDIVRLGTRRRIFGGVPYRLYKPNDQLAPIAGPI
jgi:hypothetical protein